MSTALAIVIAAVALACPMHMLWRARQRRRACCAAAADDAAAAVGARQRALAERIESLGGSATPSECGPERH